MSTEQVGVGLTLTEISKAAVGPYRAYQAALHDRHEVTGVSFEALSAEADESEVFHAFVSDTVNLLPAAQVSSLRQEPVEGYSRGRWGYDIGWQATSFTTTDSVQAEALWSSLVWYKSVPHYLVGSSDTDYFIALPSITMGSSEQLNAKANRDYPPNNIVNGARRALVKKLTQDAFKDLSKEKMPFVRYKGDLSVVTSPGLTIPVARDKLAAGWVPRVDEQFLSLASTDASEQSLADQATRLRALFDPDEKSFVLDGARVSSRAPYVNSSGLGTPNFKRISPQDIHDHKVMERLTVLAIRFGKLEEYAGKLSVLFTDVAEIRKESVTLGSQEFGSDTSTTQLAEFIIQMIRSARAAEEQKAEAGRSFGRRFFRRQKAIG